MFSDRHAAGLELLELLKPYKSHHTLVLALPRGGVLVGAPIAEGLGAEFDALIVRKLGAPHQPELAIGAVIDGEHPQTVLNDRVIALVGATAEQIRQEADRQLGEIRRRKAVYRGGRPAPAVRGRTVLVVDDGIATGATVQVALEALRRMKPLRLVLAVPVAAPDSLERLRPLADDVVCLLAPRQFQAVGQFYRDFHAPDDREVIELLGTPR